MNSLLKSSLHHKHSWSPRGDKRNLTTKLLKTHWLELVTRTLILRHFQFSMLPCVLHHAQTLTISFLSFSLLTFSPFFLRQSHKSCAIFQDFFALIKRKRDEAGGDFFGMNGKISYVTAANNLEMMKCVRWNSCDAKGKETRRHYSPVNLSF
jgi:hypothetical protein